MEQRRSQVPPVAVGGTLLAALRDDGRYGRWSLAGTAPHVVESLVAVASAHQVLPVVRDALIAARVLGTAECDAASGDATGAELARVREQVESSVVGAVAQHLRVCAELAQLVPVLDGLGVPWAVVKGPALAALAYPRPELRPYGDIDVLVGPRDFGAVLDALGDAGAVLLDRNWTYLRVHGRCEVSMRLRHGTYLDLHWHLVNNAHARAAFRLDTDEILARRRVVDVGGLAVPTLDATDTLLHVALHATISGGHRLSWVKDVERLVAVGGTDWATVVRRAEATRTALVVGVLLRRAQRLLDAKVPVAVLMALERPRSGGLTLRAVERLATPTSLVGTHHTGQLLLLTARPDARSSASALLTELGRKLAARRRAQSARADEPGATDPDGDPAGRQRYLNAICRPTDSAQRLAPGARRSASPPTRSPW